MILPLHPLRHEHSGGFSLVEVLVAMVVGLIAVAIIGNTYVQSAAKQRTIGSGGSALADGVLATYIMEREIRNGGFGVPISGAVGCPVSTSFQGSPAADSFVLAPVSIRGVAAEETAVDSGQTLSEVDVVYSNYGGSAVPVRLLTTFDPKANPAQELIDVSSNFFFAGNQFATVVDGAKPCALIQITGRDETDITNRKLIRGAGAKWNMSNSIFPEGGYAAGALVYNLGDVAWQRFFVSRADATLRSTRFTTDQESAKGVTRVLAPNVVGMKALYGIGTDANGDGALDVIQKWTADQPGDRAAWASIAALRLVLVVRSSHRERPATDGACKTTLVPPLWDGSAVPIIDKFPSCYRYQTYETTIPLRNRLWAVP